VDADDAKGTVIEASRKLKQQRKLDVTALLRKIHSINRNGR
jgi:hypothetical protein